MTKPLIAIVGSYDTTRSYTPILLQDAQTAKLAAEQLGRELAKAGYRILVYSSDTAYIEADFVRGYISSGIAEKESIQIRYPQSIGGVPAFDEQRTHKEVFDPVPDAHPNWQVTFYKSLKDVDGVIILGGASSALITGLVAQIYKIPFIPIATFGGSAQTVWAISTEKVATEAERKLMNLPLWSESSAAKLVEALNEQRKRLQAEEEAGIRLEQLKSEKVRNRAIVAALITLATVCLTVGGTFSTFKNPLNFGWFFLGTPLLAGAAGGLARNIFDSYRGIRYQVEHGTIVITFLGMLSGLVAALLFVVSQWASNPEIKTLNTTVPAGLSLLIPFELLIGIIAGLTLEAVFAKLLRTDVVNVDTISVKTPNQQP
jgi:hypothetical protein